MDSHGYFEKGTAFYVMPCQKAPERKKEKRDVSARIASKKSRENVA
jgi:hypothetical protein